MMKPGTPDSFWRMFVILLWLTLLSPIICFPLPCLGQSDSEADHRMKAANADLISWVQALVDMEKAKTLATESLSYETMSRRDPMWPMWTYAAGELFKMKGMTDSARHAYQSLAEWASTDPLGDTWGGNGLAAIALWRWTRLMLLQKTPDTGEVGAALHCYGLLKNTRFMTLMGNTPVMVISTFPQLEEDILRSLVHLAHKTDQKDRSEQLFLEYLSVSSDPHLKQHENDLLRQLIEGGKASPDRLFLIRGKRLVQLKRFSEARDLLKRAYQSNDLGVQAEAGYHLARIQYFMAFNRPEILDLLDMVLEDAQSPGLIQKALFLRASTQNHIGRGRNTQAFVEDMHRLIEEYPDGNLTDDALYKLAEHFRYRGEIEKSLMYYEQLRAFEGLNDWRNTAGFRPAFTLYSQGGPENIRRASLLLNELEQTQPFGDLHLPALFWLGRMAETSQDPEASHRYFRKLIEDAPYNFYAIRARMHLQSGEEARNMLWPQAEIRSDLKAAYQESRGARFTPTSPSPYHLRLNQAIETGLYKTVFGSSARLRSLYPSKRQETFAMDELDQSGLLPHLCILLALRQDALAARDKLPSPDNLLQIAWDVGSRAGDWTLAMNLVMAIPEPVTRKAAIERGSGFLAAAYPPVFESLIREASRKYKAPPELLYSVIRQESLFDPTACSVRGALGLFQFMPPTFRNLDKKWRILENSGAGSMEALLFDPAQCIDLGGRWFAQEVYERNKGNVLFALMDHNAGPGRVDAWQDKWRREDRTNDIEYIIETIPILETRLFTRRVYTAMVITGSAELFGPK